VKTGRSVFLTTMPGGRAGASRGPDGDGSSDSDAPIAAPQHLNAAAYTIAIEAFETDIPWTRAKITRMLQPQGLLRH